MSIRSFSLRKAVWDKTDGHCSYCGVKLTQTFVDESGKFHNFNTKDSFVVEHVTKEGGDKIENLVPACHSCNSSKRNKTVEEWGGRK